MSRSVLVHGAELPSAAGSRSHRRATSSPTSSPTSSSTSSRLDAPPHLPSLTRAQSEPRLVHRTEVPSWYLTNPHVHDGYRLDHGLRECLVSLFQWHSETLNIWSHLLAVGWWAWVVSEIRAEPVWARADDWTHVLANLAWTSVGLMFFVSAMSHCFACISPSAWVWCWRMDLFGILACWMVRVLVDTWFVAHGRTALWLAMAAAVVPFFLGLGRGILRDPNTVPQLSWAVLYALTHVGSVLLALEAVLGPGSSEALARGTQYLFGSSALALLGMVVYVLHLPERWSPGSFDRVGMSHQIWHVSICGVFALYITGVHHLVLWRFAEA